MVSFRAVYGVSGVGFEGGVSRGFGDLGFAV